MLYRFGNLRCGINGNGYKESFADGLQAPLFENFQHGFRVLVSAKEHKVGDKLSNNQEKILALIEENIWITAQSISEKIGISKRKTEENIGKLKAIADIGKLSILSCEYYIMIIALKYILHSPFVNSTFKFHVQHNNRS
jgi:hypothetical protein